LFIPRAVPKLRYKRPFDNFSVEGT
jgi:hypothetical protein